MNGNSANKKEQEATTARRLAYSLVIVYSAALLFTGGVAAYKSSEQDNQAWLDLFKSGFLVLGGGLTTVIGYYFGSRGVEEAQKVAEDARKSFEETEADLEEARREFAPTPDEEALTLPE